MAEHLPYYGHEQGCHNGRIPWGPEPCPGCVALRRAFSRGQRDERERITSLERWYLNAEDQQALIAKGQRDEREAAARAVEARGGYHSAAEFAAAIRAREERP